MQEQIKSVVKKLGLTDANGGLKPLDSLNIIDLVVELEATLDISIPSAMLTPQHFASYDAIHAMLVDLTT